MLYSRYTIQRSNPQVRRPLRSRSARPQRRPIFRFLQNFVCAVYYEFSIDTCISKTFTDRLQNFIAHSSFESLSNGTIRVSVGLFIRDRQGPKVGLFSFEICWTAFSAIFKRPATHEGSVRSARDSRALVCSGRRSEWAYPRVSSPCRSETV